MPQPYLRDEQLSFSFPEKDYVSSYGHRTDKLSDKCSEKWCMSHSIAYGIPPEIYWAVHRLHTVLQENTEALGLYAGKYGNQNSLNFQ